MTKIVSYRIDDETFGKKGPDGAELEIIFEELDEEAVATALAPRSETKPEISPDCPHMFPLRAVMWFPTWDSAIDAYKRVEAICTS